MSYRPKLIPEAVIPLLEDHIKKNCKKAETAWEFANQDEDTLTGDFLGNLRTPGWIGDSNYQFRFFYNKVRGRGNGALEKLTGTDGIITIELQLGNHRSIVKSIVFQAKKQGNVSGKAQKIIMDKYFPDANVIFRYSPDSFVVEDFDGKDIRICEFLINHFFSCEYGMYDLYYNNSVNNFVRNGKELKYLTAKHSLKLKIRKK